MLQCNQYNTQSIPKHSTNIKPNFQLNIYNRKMSQHTPERERGIEASHRSLHCMGSWFPSKFYKLQTSLLIINLQKFKGENRREKVKCKSGENRIAIGRGEVEGREIRTFLGSWTWSMLRSLPPEIEREIESEESESEL
jgi:hypothetical protein